MPFAVGLSDSKGSYAAVTTLYALKVAETNMLYKQGLWGGPVVDMVGFTNHLLMLFQVSVSLNVKMSMLKVMSI